MTGRGRLRRWPSLASRPIPGARRWVLRTPTATGCRTSTLRITRAFRSCEAAEPSRCAWWTGGRNRRARTRGGCGSWADAWRSWGSRTSSASTAAPGGSSPSRGQTGSSSTSGARRFARPPWSSGCRCCSATSTAMAGRTSMSATTSTFRTGSGSTSGAGGSGPCHRTPSAGPAISRWRWMPPTSTATGGTTCSWWTWPAGRIGCA